MQRLLILLFFITLNACSTYTDRSNPAPVETRNESPPLVPEVAESQKAGSPTATLLAASDAAKAEGDLERAAALAERALRISPRDAYLWYTLADIRYQQKRHSDAVGFAQRARSFAGANRQLTGEIDALLKKTEARR